MNTDEQIMNTDEQIIEPVKTKYYCERVKNSIYKYRNNNREEYNSRQREYYKQNKLNPEWRLMHNQRCKISNEKYRQKKLEDQSIIKRPVGRPKKSINNIKE